MLAVSRLPTFLSFPFTRAPHALRLTKANKIETIQPSHFMQRPICNNEFNRHFSIKSGYDSEKVQHLFQAIKYGKLEELQKNPLLDSSIDIKDEEGMTPLHRAAQKCDPEIIRFLISKGAKAEVTNKEGLTPFDLFNYQFAKINPKDVAEKIAHLLRTEISGDFFRDYSYPTAPDQVAKWQSTHDTNTTIRFDPNYGLVATKNGEMGGIERRGWIAPGEDPYFRLIFQPSGRFIGEPNGANVETNLVVSPTSFNAPHSIPYHSVPDLGFVPRPHVAKAGDLSYIPLLQKYVIPRSNVGTHSEGLAFRIYWWSPHNHIFIMDRAVAWFTATRPISGGSY